MEVLSCPEEYQTFNKLACKCFYDARCEIGCFPGKQVSPDSTCTCETEDYIRSLFPLGVTDEQIVESANLSPFLEQSSDYDAKINISDAVKDVISG